MRMSTMPDRRILDVEGRDARCIEGKLAAQFKGELYMRRACCAIQSRAMLCHPSIAGENGAHLPQDIKF